MKGKFGIAMVIVIGAGLMTNCGTLKTKEKNQKAAQTVMALSGEWNSSCHKQQWFDFTQVTETYKFSALGDFEKELAISKNDCATTDILLLTGGTYDALGDDKNAPEAKDINFTINQASLTPKSARAVKMLNSMKYCSISDWAEAKRQDILGRACALMDYAKGEVSFDIYRQEGNQLLFGQKMFLLTKDAAGNRPNKLDEQHVFIKK